MTTEGFKMEIPNNVLSDGKSSISVSICRPTVCYIKCAIVVRPTLNTTTLDLLLSYSSVFFHVYSLIKYRHARLHLINFPR